MDAAALPNRRRRDVLELSVGYGLILLVLWTARPWQRPIYCVTALFLVIVLWRSFTNWQDMGLRVANLGRSLWIVGVALVLAAIAILLARRMHTLHWDGELLPFVKRYWGYAIWAFAQQILLQDYFLARFRGLICNPVLAALAATATFSFAHLPNPILTVLTFVWGLAACLLFLRYRNLYPLALAHILFGITIAIAVPAPAVRNMRVGLGYFRYVPPGSHLRGRGNHRKPPTIPILRNTSSNIAEDRSRPGILRETTV